MPSGDDTRKIEDEDQEQHTGGDTTHDIRRLLEPRLDERGLAPVMVVIISRGLERRTEAVSILHLTPPKEQGWLMQKYINTIKFANLKDRLIGAYPN